MRQIISIARFLLTVLIFLCAPKFGIAQQCSLTLEYDHEFVGDSPPVAGSSAILSIRLADEAIRYTATHPVDGIDTGTVHPSIFNCFTNRQPTPCCGGEEPNRITFVYDGDEARIYGNVLLAPYNRAVVDLFANRGRVRYLHLPCASTPIISGGRAKYRGRLFHKRVFRRGQDKPIIKVRSVNATTVFDIYKVDITDKTKRTLVKRVSKVSNNGGFTVATWDWSNDRNWKVPDDIPIGLYEIRAVAVRPPVDGRSREVTLGRCEFYAIFDKLTALSGKDEKAYLYDKVIRKSTRDIRSIWYSPQDTRHPIRDGSGKISYETVDGKRIKKQRFGFFGERGYTQDPFSEKVFAMAIYAADGQTVPHEASEGLMQAVSNTIYYIGKSTRPFHTPGKYARISPQQFRAAFSNTQELYAIPGQCNDYANNLTAFERSIGIAARPATDIQDGGFNYHVWTEAFLKTPPNGTDKWYVYDAMDYVTPSRNNRARDKAADWVGSSPRSTFAYGKKAYEVAVGNNAWKINNGLIRMDFATSRAKHHNTQSKDALFEKCESEKYDLTGCNLPDPPVAEESEHLRITLNSDSYRVGDTLTGTLQVDNTLPVAAEGLLKFRIYRVAATGDDREAFGDPVLGISGTGVPGESLYELDETITIPAGSAIGRPISLVLTDTDYPNDGYMAQLEFAGDEIDDLVAMGFEVRPGYEVTVDGPDDIGPTDPFTLSLALVNPTSLPISGIELSLEIPDHIVVSGPDSAPIPPLAPGATTILDFLLTPQERRVAAHLPIELRVISTAAGSHTELIEQPLEVPPVLHVASEVVELEAFGSGTVEIPLSFKVENLGEQVATDVVVDITLPDDVPAGSLVLSEDLFLVDSIASGEEVEITTTLTSAEEIDTNLLIGVAGNESFTEGVIGIRFAP